MRKLTITLALLLVSPLLHAAITGSVIDANGNPVAGATVRAFKVETRPDLLRRIVSGKIDLEPLATAKTSDTGDFRLDKVGQPTVDVVAEAAGRETIARFTADGEDLTLMMREAKPRRLKVTANGKPVANAIVMYGRPLFTRTGSDGTFEIPTLQPAPRITVYHPDFAPLEPNLERNDTEVKLENGTKLTGKVAGVDGKPAANIDVVAGFWPLAKSGDDGSFTIAHAPSSWRELRAETASDIAIVTRAGGASYTLHLRRGTRVTGVVRDVKTRTPVAGMIVGARGEGTITDASGAFTISPILPGRYPVTAAHPLYESMNSGPLAALVVTPAGVKETLAATPLPLISGTVIDEDRKPVAGATVGRINRFAELSGGGTYTRHGGTFSFHAMVMPVDHQIDVSKDGYADTVFSVTPGETKSGVNVTLKRGVPLAMRVIDASRNAVPGVVVHVAPPREGFSMPREVRCNGGECTTASDGTLTLRVAPAKYEIALAGADIVAKRVTQNVDAHSAPLTITVERGADVSGRVTYTDGKPLTSPVRVMIDLAGTPIMSVTDDSGAFVLHGAPKGKVSLRASDMAGGGRFTGPAKEVMAPAANVVLTFPRGGHISGRVVDSSTGGPITDFEVNAMHTAGFAMPGNSTPVHSDDGSFTLNDVQPGRVEVVATAENYVRGNVTGLEVAEGQAIDNVEVRLDRAGRLKGKVTSSDGQPLSGAVVSVIDNTPRRMGQPADRGTTDGDGMYELSSVPAGQRNVAFSKEGFVPATKSVEAAAGKESQLDVTLDRGHQLAGRVIDDSGQPVAAADIRVDGEPMRPIQTDTDGSFQIAGLRDGKVRVTAFKNGYSNATEEVDTASQTNVTLTLGHGATISGRVTGLTAAEMGVVNVGFYSMGGSSGNTHPDAAGNFTLSGARDGKVTVQAAIYGAANRITRKIIDVANGTAPEVELAFTQGFTVRGRVNAQGRPLNDFRVSFSPTDSSLPPGNAGIDTDGSYAVSGLGAGDYRVFVVAPAYGTVYNDKYTVSGDGMYDIDLHASSIRGRVTDRDGKPLSDVRIMASAIKGSGTGQTMAPRPGVTDSDGRYLLDFVQDGTFHLVAQRDQYQPATRDVTVAGGAPDVDFQLDTGAASTVRVADASGAPIFANVTVTDQGHTLSSAQTNASDGVAQLWLPPGHYQLFAGAQGYARAQTTIDVPGQEVRVTLSHGGTIIAIVKDPTKVQVALVAAGQPAGGAVSMRGDNRWDHVAPGMWEVREYIPGNKTPIQVKSVTVADDQTVTVRVD
jgi:protocatechuate 3,4-dioxygenase beta subunit